MGSIINHNMTAANANRMLGVTSSAQAKSSEKLSSGLKINRAGDDAAGLTISEKMRSQIRGLTKASSNAQDGIAAIKVAEGALTESHSILQRMNELATQGANDLNTSSDRYAIREELKSLADELTRIRSTTSYNTQNLLDGSFSQKLLQVGALNGHTISISINDMGATGLGVEKVPSSKGTNKVFGTYMSKVQAAIKSVSGMRSRLGALQNRLEHTVANLDNIAENTQSAESRIRDTDMATEMVEFSKNNILTQAGQSMLAQANQSTQGVLSLLQ